MKSMFDPNINLCAKVMDLRLQRQNLVIGNITNVNTPNYSPRRLDFEDKLQAALGRDAKGKVTRTQQEHLPATFTADGFQGDWEKEFKPRHEHGQDGVDLDKEMAILNKNTMQYDALTTIVKQSFDKLNDVIQKSSS